MAGDWQHRALQMYVFLDRDDVMRLQVVSGAGQYEVRPRARSKNGQAAIPTSDQWLEIAGLDG